MNESDLRTAITAHEDAIREHLTDFLNHAIEIGKLTTLFAASVPPPVTPPTHTLPLRAGETTWQRAYTTFYRAAGQEDRKSTRLNSSHIQKSRMPSSA